MLAPNKSCLADLKTMMKALALTSVVLLPAIGQASNLEACNKYCSSEASLTQELCNGDDAPGDICNDFNEYRYQQSCVAAVCDYEAPDFFFSGLAKSKRMLFAQETVINELGEDYTVLSERPFYGPNETVLGYVFTASRDPQFVNNPSAWAKQSQHIQDTGHIDNPFEFDATFGYVVLGNRSFTPPVIGAGTGLDAGFHLLTEGRAAVVNAYGSQLDNYTFVRAHFDAFHPILEFSRSGQKYFYNSRRGTTARNFQINTTPPSTVTARSMGVAAQWLTFLSRK